MYCSWPSSMDACHSTLQFAQRRAVDIHGVAVMPHTTEQRVHHRFVAEEVMPLVIDQIGCNDGGMAVVPLLHQFEEDVALLGLQGQISKFVDQKHVQAGKAFQELPCGTVGQRRIHFIEQILRADELTTVAVLQRLQQQTARYSRLVDTRLSDSA